MSKIKRKGNYIIHYILTAILIVAVLVTLSLTVLFKAEKLEITGIIGEEIRAQINDSASYALGQNLFRLSFDDVRTAVLGACPTLSDVKVSRGLPNKIKIECSASVPVFAVTSGNEILLLSDTGRIIGLGEGILVQNLYGINTDGASLGDFILSPEQLAFIEKINTEFGKTGMLVDIDLSNPSNIKAIYQDRIKIDLADLSELSYYAQSTAEIIKTKLEPTDKGRIFAVGGAFHFDPTP